jgi:hypothetical protein
MASISIANDLLDQSCKTIAQRLLALGFNKAGENYEVSSERISDSELHHLLTHGAVRNVEPPISILAVYAKTKFGPNAGKVFGFRLNYDLEP